VNKKKKKNKIKFLKKKRKKYSGQQQKEIDYDEPIRHRMKKRNPSSGQNDQLVHWWLLIHSGPFSSMIPVRTIFVQNGNKNPSFSLAHY